MTDYSERQTFPDTSSAFTDLQANGFRLWQWLDHTTTVWWGRGSARVVLRPVADGGLEALPLPELSWDSIGQSVGTVANTAGVRDLGET